MFFFVNLQIEKGKKNFTLNKTIPLKIKKIILKYFK